MASVATSDPVAVPVAVSALATTTVASDEDTMVIPAIVVPEPMELTKPVEAAEPVSLVKAVTPTETTPTEEPATKRPPRGAHADLQMLRENPPLRARCAAALIVPFMLFIAALLVTDRIGSFLVWIWLPIVIAGVLIGVCLDLGYRHERLNRIETSATSR